MSIGNALRAEMEIDMRLSGQTVTVFKDWNAGSQTEFEAKAVKDEKGFRFLEPEDILPNSIIQIKGGRDYWRVIDTEDLITDGIFHEFRVFVMKVDKRGLETRLPSQQVDANFYGNITGGIQIGGNQNSQSVSTTNSEEKDKVPNNRTENTQVTRNPRKVFVVHGRNEKARKALFAFLRSLGLAPQEWAQWVHSTGHGSPYTGEVIKQGFKEAQAFVVLLTPDDEARLREPLRGDNEGAHETDLTPQPRPNVLFEAGMAIGIDERRTILIELGKLRPVSDILGRHVVRIDKTASKRKDLAQRLEKAGCPVDLIGDDWLEAGDFESALEGL